MSTVIVSLIDLRIPTPENTTTGSMDIITPTTSHHMFTLLQKRMRNAQSKRAEFLNCYLDVFYSVEFQPCDILRSVFDNRITDCREIMKRAVKTNGLALEFFSGEYTYNHGVLSDEIVMHAVKSNGMALSFPLKVHKNIARSIIVQAVMEDGQILARNADLWNRYSELQLIAAENNGLVMEEVVDNGIDLSTELVDMSLIENPYIFQRDFQPSDVNIAEYIIRSFGMALEEFDADYNIPLDSLIDGLSQYPEALPHLYWNFGKDSDEKFQIIKASVKSYNDSFSEDLNLYFLPKCQMKELLSYSGELLYELMNPDRDMVLSAINNCGTALACAPQYCNDREIVLDAVRQDVESILYASEALFYDREFILECVKISGEVLEFIDDDFDNDREIILEAVKNYGEAIGITSNELRKDKEIVITALSNNGDCLGYLDADFQNDKSIVLIAVSNSGLSLEYASSELQNDREVVMTAISNNASSLIHASEILRSDKEIVVHAVELTPHSFEYASNQAKNDWEIVMECLKIYGPCLKFASAELKKNKQILLQAAKQNGLSIACVEGGVDDDEVALEAVKNNPLSYQYLSSRLKRNRTIAKLAKEQSDLYWDVWNDYWAKRSAVFDVEKPKRGRSYCEYLSCEERELKKLKEME